MPFVLPTPTRYTCRFRAGLILVHLTDLVSCIKGGVATKPNCYGPTSTPSFTRPLLRNALRKHADTRHAQTTLSKAAAWCDLLFEANAPIQTLLSWTIASTLAPMLVTSVRTVSLGIPPGGRKANHLAPPSARPSYN